MVADEECRCGDSDIPGGFQDLNPMLFIIIAQIIGDITASRIPFNVQNALGKLASINRSSYINL